MSLSAAPPRPQIWLFTAVHTALLVLIKLDKLDDLWESIGLHEDVRSAKIVISFSALSVTTTLMSFMLIFFNGQCFTRYMNFYGACTGIHGTLQNISQLTAVHLEGDDARWDVLRYLQASALMVYMKVTDPPGAVAQIDADEWDRMLQSEEEWLGLAPGGQESSFSRRPTAASFTTVSPALLTPGEKLLLERYQGNMPNLVLQTWALRALRDGYKRQGLIGPVYTHTEGQVLALRGHCAFITNALALPVPFPYYHSMVLLMFINFAMYTIAFLDLNSWLSPIAFFLVLLITTGIREVSCALANPFGTDEVDFPVQKYIRDLRALIAGIVEAPWPPGTVAVAPKAVARTDGADAPGKPDAHAAAQPTPAQQDQARVYEAALQYQQYYQPRGAAAAQWSGTPVKGGQQKHAPLPPIGYDPAPPPPAPPNGYYIRNEP